MTFPTFDGLPEMCFLSDGDTGRIIALKRGEPGFYETALSTSEAARNDAIAESYNKKLGVTKAQVAAMEAGSMFGWHVPGADPSRYDENGRYRAVRIEII